MSEAIPVIDVADYLAGRSGALEAVARQVHDALTTVGFFVLTGHDVPLTLIERAFAEARRFHQLPMDKKLALKLNDHINGYMVMGRYAVRTSDINDNEKGDLNEAFFIKRERAPNDPLLLSGRRFVGPNLWPEEADLPGFRAHVLDYVDTMDRFTARLVRGGLRRQPVHLSPVALPAGQGRAQPVRHRAAQRQQFHDLLGANRGAWPAGAHAVKWA
jgi:isopenicillin N synthase-like dioxygenase